VRKAQLAVLKGKKHYVVDDGNPNFAGFKKLDLEIAEWTSKTIEEIIENTKKLQSEIAIKGSAIRRWKGKCSGSLKKFDCDSIDEFLKYSRDR
jgi:hypothetical protein